MPPRGLVDASLAADRVVPWGQAGRSGKDHICYTGSTQQLSIANLHVGSSQIAVSVKRAGINYFTTVTAPAGWKLTIGYTLPANSQVKSVTLNGSPASFQIAPTNRGEEVKVQANSGGTQQVRIQTE